MKTINELMQEFKEGKLKQDVYTSINENGESVIVSYFFDNEGKGILHVRTLQSNGWSRTNIYYEDGTIEEIYSK